MDYTIAETSTSLTGGSTQYIQNTLSPTTTTQTANVSILNIYNSSSTIVISTGIFNVNSTVDPLTLMNNGSSEANEANLGSFRWVGNITGVTTQMVPLYCKLTNTSNSVNALADGVCAYLWSRDTAGDNGNLYGAEARVTAQGTAKQYTAMKLLTQWISPDLAHDTIGTTSTIVGLEVSNQMLKSDGVTILATGTVIDLLIDANQGTGAPGSNWTIYSPSADPSWLEGGLEIGTGGANQAASFIVAATSITSTGKYAVLFGTAAFNKGLPASAYMVMISTNGHFLTSTGGGQPTVSTCGTGSPSVSGDDNQGTITVGGGAVTSCTLNFAQTWGVAPTCTISDNSTAITGDISSISATSFTASFSLSIGGGLIYYRCSCSGVNCL